MAKRVLYLIRHGEYKPMSNSNIQTDGPPTDKGQQQVHHTAKRLQHLPIQTVHTSDLNRAKETADIIVSLFPHINCLSTALLRECIPCVPKRFETIFNDAPSENHAHNAFDTFFKPPDHSKDQHKIIVSHSNLIRFFVTKTFGEPCDSWINMCIHHCGIAEIEIERPFRLKLVRHNDFTHLPDHLLSDG